MGNADLGHRVHHEVEKLERSPEHGCRGGAGFHPCRLAVVDLQAKALGSGLRV